MPEIGLSIYNFEFSYNPNFAVRVTGSITTTQCQVIVAGSNSDPNVGNELYIMFIASDYYEHFGIYRIEGLSTLLVYCRYHYTTRHPQRRVQEPQSRVQLQDGQWTEFLQPHKPTIVQPSPGFPYRSQRRIRTNFEWIRPEQRQLRDHWEAGDLQRVRDRLEHQLSERRHPDHQHRLHCDLFQHL